MSNTIPGLSPGAQLIYKKVHDLLDVAEIDGATYDYEDYRKLMDAISAEALGRIQQSFETQQAFPDPMEGAA